MSTDTKKTMLDQGKKKLAHMQAAQASPTMSPAGKATLAQAIIQQQAIIISLERALGLIPSPNL